MLLLVLLKTVATIISMRCDAFCTALHQPVVFSATQYLAIVDNEGAVRTTANTTITSISGGSFIAKSNLTFIVVAAVVV